LVNLLLPAGAAIAAWAGRGEAATGLLSFWLAAVVLYGVACAAASAQAARKHGAALLPLLPVVFAIYHVAYGAGFLANAVGYFFARSGSLQAGRAFTSVTR
jgi:hypothetical protein